MALKVTIPSAPLTAPPTRMALGGDAWFAREKFVDAVGNLNGAITSLQLSSIAGTSAVDQLPANVPVVSFGTGAPGGAGSEGYLYFDTSGSPYTGYVYHSGAWQQFS